jgi:hypothetical protein
MQCAFQYVLHHVQRVFRHILNTRQQTLNTHQFHELNTLQLSLYTSLLSLYVLCSLSLRGWGRFWGDRGRIWGVGTQHGRSALTGPHRGRAGPIETGQAPGPALIPALTLIPLSIYVRLKEVQRNTYKE